MFLVEMFENKSKMPDPAHALPGRAQPVATSKKHFVSGKSIHAPFPQGLEVAYFGMGCFWGAERLFWETDGVYVTAAGYQGGFTPNPTYQETTTGRTGHAETVMVVYDPAVIAFTGLLKIFFEEHDPTQGMRQGNDVGTTYRSTIYTTTKAQLDEALATRDAYQTALTAARRDRITTEICEAPVFYYAEDYHQQYLAKNPNGYCGLRGTGVACPGGTPAA